MNEKELIRRGLKVRGKTQDELTKMYGYASQGSISNILNPKRGMKVDVMVRMFDLLGYDVYIIDRESGERLGRVTTKTEKPKKIQRKVEVVEEVQEKPVEKAIPTFQYGRR